MKPCKLFSLMYFFGISIHLSAVAVKNFSVENDCDLLFHLHGGRKEIKGKGLKKAYKCVQAYTFKGFNFKGADCSAMQFIDCLFEDVHFENVNFLLASFEGCCFKNCSFSHVDFEGTEFCSFRHDITWIKTFFACCSFSQSDFSLATFTNVLFVKSRIEHCRLREVSLDGIRFFDVSCNANSFFETHWTDCSLYFSSFSRSKFSDSSLCNILFDRCSWSYNHFYKSTYQDVHFYQNTISMRGLSGIEFAAGVDFVTSLKAESVSFVLEKEGFRCSVCWDDIEDVSLERTFLSCGHKLCCSCYAGLVINDTFTCPCCRKDFNLNKDKTVELLLDNIIKNSVLETAVSCDFIFYDNDEANDEVEYENS